MWRAIHSIGRGLRSVRPSQCCPQDCSEECPSKYCNHHHHYNEVSKAQAATLRHYSAASCWSPLAIKSNDNSMGGTTCTSTQAVYLYHSSFSKVGEEIHKESCVNGSPGTEGRGSASYHPRCPPWHWQILQDSQKLEKYCSEKKEKEEEQNTKDWGKTCYSQEWKEVLQSSPTLHALGWCSAAALTWSLYHDWREHHLCPYKKKDEQQQTLHRVSRNHSSNPKDEKNEDILNYHKRFNDFFPFENNSQEVSSESSDGEDNYKNSLGKIYKVPNFQCNFKSTKTFNPNLAKSHECQTQETIIPVYSLQHKFLDVARKVFSTQETDYAKVKHKLEKICKDEDELHDMNESLFSLEEEWSDVPEKTDSGCISDLNQSFQSQTCSIKLEIAQSQYNLNEKSNVIKTVSDTSPERSLTETFESELSTGEKEAVNEHHQPTTQNEPVNNSDDKEMNILHDRLLEIVKAYHEERMSDTLKKDGKNLFDTKPEEMVVYFQAGVLVGDTNSAFNLALCYHMGHGVTQDLEKAQKLYKVASAAGHGWATYNLAVLMLNQSIGSPFLPAKAHSLLLQAAKMGVKEAEDALSVLEKEKQQQIVPQEDEPHLRQCYSEPCLFSALDNEWSSSYSTSDLQSLQDENDWTIGDFFAVTDVSQKI